VDDEHPMIQFEESKQFDDSNRQSLISPKEFALRKILSDDTHALGKLLLSSIPKYQKGLDIIMIKQMNHHLI